MGGHCAVDWALLLNDRSRPADPSSSTSDIHLAAHAGTPLFPTYIRGAEFQMSPSGNPADALALRRTMDARSRVPRAEHGHNERRTWFVVALTATMMVGEITAGSLFGSMALFADGWHMATHAARWASPGSPICSHGSTPAIRVFRSAPANSATSRRLPARSSLA